mgnify:CR=1 FL=1
MNSFMRLISLLKGTGYFIEESNDGVKFKIPQHVTSLHVIQDSDGIRVTSTRVFPSFDIRIEVKYSPELGKMVISAHRLFGKEYVSVEYSVGRFVFKREGNSTVVEGKFESSTELEG